MALRRHAPAVRRALDGRRRCGGSPCSTSFVTIARRWPGLSVVVHERLAEQLEVAAVRGAIAGLPRVEQRVLALLWQLADRCGVVRPDGIAIELSLTHALIGHLVGAQRPTISLAFHALGEAGFVSPGESGTWVVAHDSLATLEAEGAFRVTDFNRPAS